MKRLFAASIAAAFAFTLSASEVSAQSWAFIGAAATIPMGDFADFGDGDGANTGFMANGGVMFPVGEGALSVGGGAFFGSNGHDSDGDKTNLYGANALIGAPLGDPQADTRPFVYGGLGYLVHAYKSDSFGDASEGGLAATGGGGVAFTAGESLSIMVSGSYTLGFGDVDGTTFVSLGAAAQIPVG